MQKRKILYITSSRDPTVTTPQIEDYYRAQPWCISAILYHLQSFGWENERLAFRESWEPWRVAKRLEAFSPDVVFTYGVTAMSPVIARRWLGRWRGPIVHGWDDYYDEIWRAQWGRIAGAFMHWYEQRLVCASDAVITLSHYNERRARAWGLPTWHIPNGCDEITVDPATCPVQLDAAFKLVYLGDQSRYKRAYEIVDAMKQVPKDIKLFMVGRPYEYLVRGAPENVVFLGPRYGDEKWGILAQADALVCTADQDCNAKFHEYLRFRKPILAYDGKPNLLFRNGHNALLTRDYAGAIMKLSQSRELRQRLAENAAADLPVCNWHQIAERYADSLTEILGRYQANGLAPPDGAGITAGGKA